jgi:hypothetical protein
MEIDGCRRSAFPPAWGTDGARGGHQATSTTNALVSAVCVMDGFRLTSATFQLSRPMGSHDTCELTGP